MGSFGLLDVEVISSFTSCSG